MRTVFIDVDSQRDFLYPAGALYVPGAEHIVPAIAHLNRFAAASGIPVVSTTDAHFENDPEFKQWPPHCITGTWGQHKADATLLETRVVVPNCECSLALEGAKQIVVEKQTVDVFQARNLSRVIEMLAGDCFVIYGVVTEICVLYAARGLLKMGKRVTIVSDAVKELDAPASRETLDNLRGEGAPLATVSEITAIAP